MAVRSVYPRSARHRPTSPVPAPASRIWPLRHVTGQQQRGCLRAAVGEIILGICVVLRGPLIVPILHFLKVPGSVQPSEPAIFGHQCFLRNRLNACRMASRPGSSGSTPPGPSEASSSMRRTLTSPTTPVNHPNPAHRATKAGSAEFPAPRWARLEMPAHRWNLV